jgi:hypothetical protein
MNPTSALSSLQNSNPLLAILWAGFTCGTLDISAALVVYRYFGRPPMRLLQGIAAGGLGSRSFQGGPPTALLGLFCHFFIAFSAATVYLTASRWIPFLLAHAVISGVFYGVAVYFFMNRVVGNECRSRTGPSATRRRFAKPLTGRSCHPCLGRVDLQRKSQRLRQH